MQNEMDTNSTPKPNTSRKQEQALEQACNLNYSSTMNILQSSLIHQVPPGLPNHQMIYIVNSNNYILCKNLNQYQNRKLMYLCPNTASSQESGQPNKSSEPNVDQMQPVDQWEWDSKEMWQDILNNAQFLEEVAAHWILPVAAGYLPIKYRDHLAGSRLVAISKSTKTRNPSNQCHQCMATYTSSQRIAFRNLQNIFKLSTTVFSICNSYAKWSI